jgi:hypothetical protein
MTAAGADRFQVTGAWTTLQGVGPAFAAGSLVPVRYIARVDWPTILRSRKWLRYITNS